MLYVLGILWGMLAGYVSADFMYHATAGSEKARRTAGIMWGVGIGIICFICAIGG